MSGELVGEEGAPSESRLRAEIVLDPALSFGFRPRSSAPPRIMLTGGTGFLGANLVHDLVMCAGFDVCCLVRAEGAEAGRARLRRALEEQRLWRPELEHRVTIVSGDLSAPHFGLDEAEFTHLAESCDAVLHNGAHVNFYYPYSRLRAPNVRGTGEALRFASRAGGVPFHYVSTIAVFSSRSFANVDVIDERLRVEEIDGMKGGYVASKWVGEGLVNLAAERGASVVIHRPGVILGHSRTGICQRLDRLSMLLRAAVLFQSVPRIDGGLFVTPVDYVSRAIVEAAKCESREPRAYHLIAGELLAWSEVVNMLLESGLVRLEIPYGEWLQLLRRYVHEHPRCDLVPLSYILSDEPPMIRNNQRRFACDRARSLLQSLPELEGWNDARRNMRRYVAALAEQKHEARAPRANEGISI
jgi:thioester reductase-like protein